MYNTMGTKTSESMTTPRQLWFKKYFKNMKFPTYVYAKKDVDLSRLLLTKILRASNIVATKSRRGPAHFVIVNPQVSSLLQDSSLFVYDNGISPNISNGGSVYPVGSVAGLTVLVDPFMKWSETTILAGRCTKNGDTGTYLIEGDGEIGRGFEEVQSFDSLQSRLCLGSRRAFIATNGAESSYVKLDLVFKKKPWWRKLLKI